MLGALLVGLDALTAGEDPWRTVKAWRRLRERIGAVQRDPQRDYEYDSYPDHDRPPRVQPWLLVFDDDGKFTGEAEPLDTDGLSVREILPSLHRDSGPHGRFWLANRLVQGHARLIVRIGLPGTPNPDD